MIVYYAHGGGYTELGGISEFLRKIRQDLNYQRIFPAVEKLPKKDKIRINKGDEGVSGKDLFKKLRERIELLEKEVKIIIVIDDGDCRFYNKEQKFLTSLENFRKYLDEKNIKGIFLLFEPEIEKIFCVDKSWHKNVACNNKDLHRILDTLLQNINFALDEEKNSCKEKFSIKFADVLLRECNINYSKKNDGSEYLKKISPEKVAQQDGFVKNFIKEIQQIGK